MIEVYQKNDLANVNQKNDNGNNENPHNKTEII